MKHLFFGAVALVVFAGCSAQDVATELPGLPSQEDIENQVAQELASKGIAMPDLDAQEPEMVAKPALDLKADRESTGLSNPTVKELWPKAEAYAQKKFPKAVLIGYNNFGPTFTNDYLIPARAFDNGKSNRWYYLFVNDSSAFEDELLDEKGEVFAVAFSNGDLELKSVSIVQNDISPQELFGAELLAVDSNVLVDNAKKAVAEQYSESKFQYASLDCKPMWPATFASGNGDCHVILYVTENRGFDVEVFNKTGEVQDVSEVEFKDLF